MTATAPLPIGTHAARSVTITDARPSQQELLGPRALDLLAALSRRFACRRHDLLRARVRRHAIPATAAAPDRLPRTVWIRAGDWMARPLPADLRTRTVEIIGGTGRRGMVQAMNSGAAVYVADFRHGMVPTWANVLSGHLNLRDAVDRTIGFEDDDGRYHGLQPAAAIPAIRPRGWDQMEDRVEIDGRPICAALFDLGLFAVHNAAPLRGDGHTPHAYLPDIETCYEARLWSDVLRFIESHLALPAGTMRVTIVLQSVEAALQLDEIIFELRDHAAGIHLDPWGYLADVVHHGRHRPDPPVGDRDTLAGRHCPGPLQAARRVMVAAAQRRGLVAIGGDGCTLPAPPDADERDAWREYLVGRLTDEVADGLDGTLVCHPALAELARGVFDARLARLGRPAGSGAYLSAADLYTPGAVDLSLDGLRHNVTALVRYTAGWLQGRGATAVAGRLERGSTLALAAAQLWHALHHRPVLADGDELTPALVVQWIGDAMTSLEDDVGELGMAAAGLGRVPALVSAWINHPHQPVEPARALDQSPGADRSA